MLGRAHIPLAAALLSALLVIASLAGSHSPSALTAARAATAAVPTPTAPPPYCQVQYQVNSDWGTGFDVTITVTYNGPQVSVWTLQYGYAGNQALQNGWSGTWSQNGTVVTVGNAAWNGSLSPGGSVQFGANFLYSGRNAPPAGFLFNGRACGPCTGDAAPDMTITSPANGATVTVGSPVTLQASVFSGCAVAAVSYSAAPAASLGSSTAVGISFYLPYTVVWTPQASGTYAIAGTAITSGGTLSAAVTVQVVAPGG